MLLPEGEYCYEIRRGAEVIAREETTLTNARLSGVRRGAFASDRHEVETELDSADGVWKCTVRSHRGPFTRSASYEAADEILRGTVSAGAGSTSVEAKLGRFREIDADLVVMKALIIAHIRARGAVRFTGRVATIDAATLVAASRKQTYRQRANDAHQWLFEPHLGESEEVEIDDAGRIVCRRDSRGCETRLTSFTPRV
ncbi:MAG: hypothetical protein ACREQF_02860 [Candidatus Binataceae bacterium]